MDDVRLSYGDEVVFPWGGTIEAHGTVAEVYGPEGRRKVVVALTPEISGYIVDEATTVVAPIDSVRLVRA